MFHNQLVLRHGDVAVELFNAARTAAYLKAAPIEGINPCDVLDFGGCEAYRYVPCGVPCAEGMGCELLDFVDPVSDPAPWYNPAIPYSSEALGFYVTEWTGLDSSHVGASFTPTQAFTGGGVIGAPSSSGRVMKLNVILMALSERAMLYLFQWLSSQLLGRCNGCLGDSAYLRLWCPDDLSDPSDGIVELRDVGLTEGLSWVSSASSRQGSCFIREASFTLTAADPCMYHNEMPIAALSGCQVADLEECFTESRNVHRGRYRCRPSCSEMDDSCRVIIPVDVPAGVGSAGLVMRLENLEDTRTFPFRVSVYANPNEVPWASGFPCGLPLVSQINVNSMPPSSSASYDTSTRKVSFRNVTTGSFVDGSFLLQANEPGTSRFSQLACGLHLITVEPLSFCVEETVDGWVDASGTLYVEPRLPNIAITTRERTFCS